VILYISSFELYSPIFLYFVLLKFDFSNLYNLNFIAKLYKKYGKIWLFSVKKMLKIAILVGKFFTKSLILLTSQKKMSHVTFVTVTL
tara:strand:+ start:1185 stop:1445 length:261 start_codon:yes stop_codon:yes gene_type:complete